MIKTVLAAVLVLLCGAASAEPRHQAAPICDNKDVMRPCAYQPNFLAGVKSIKIRMHRISVVHSSDASSEIVSHPAGCPARLFCGCGAAVRVFGSPIRTLWLAAAWFKFPRAEPASGMVAVRAHHVFVLERHIEGSVWLAYDANSGGGATRIHARSISGYTVVNPHAG